MNDKILLTIVEPFVETFSRKNGRTGQSIVFIDEKKYRHTLDAVDKEDFDLEKAVKGVKSVTFVCSVRNQRVTITFGDKGSRNQYMNVFTITSVVEVQ